MDFLLARQAHQQRVLNPAGRAPRGKDVQHHHLAAQGAAGQAHPLDKARWEKIGKVEIRRGLVEQRRWQLARVAARKQGDGKIPRQRREQQQRHQEDQPAHLAYSAAAGWATGLRAATPTRQRRSVRLTTPPSAMMIAPSQIQETIGL